MSKEHINNKLKNISSGYIVKSATGEIIMETPYLQDATNCAMDNNGTVFGTNSNEIEEMANIVEMYAESNNDISKLHFAPIEKISNGSQTIWRHTI